jgi:hypothetical protein
MHSAKIAAAAAEQEFQLTEEVVNAESKVSLSQVLL